MQDLEDKIDGETMKRMNRDSEVKRYTKDMSDDELRIWINTQVAAELARIQANRILIQQK